MADIIRLEDRRNHKPPPPPHDGTAARILLFTGVRYERLESPKRRTGPGAKRPKTKTRKQG